MCGGNSGVPPGRGSISPTATRRWKRRAIIRGPSGTETTDREHGPRTESTDREPRHGPSTETRTENADTDRDRDHRPGPKPQTGTETTDGNHGARPVRDRRVLKLTEAPK